MILATAPQGTQLTGFVQQGSSLFVGFAGHVSSTVGGVLQVAKNGSSTNQFVTGTAVLAIAADATAVFYVDTANEIVRQCR